MTATVSPHTPHSFLPARSTLATISQQISVVSVTPKSKDGADLVNSPTEKVELSPANSQDKTNAITSSTSSSAGRTTDEELSLDLYLKLSKMKARDTEVRAHEQAHLAAAGQYASGGASFSYQVGPDGRRYAVSGEVPVDISKGATPEETVHKMERIRTAALAPAQPSSADRQIAAQAAMKASQARQEILLERQQAQPGTAVDSANDDTSTDQVAPNESPDNGISPDNVQTSFMIRRYSEIQSLKQ